jgi:predicted histone-like DNA-binding protein
MSIKYQVLQRQDPRDRSVPGKFYAALTKRYEITFDELLNEIIDISTVSIGDTYNVLQTLIHLIKKHLQEGRTLKVGDLGTFYVTINSDGKDSDQEVDSNSIKKANIRFRPSVKLKDAMNRLKFNRIDENGAPPGGE